MENLNNQHFARKPKRIKKFVKAVLNIAILLAVFGVGVGVGNGKITFGPDALFRRPVNNNKATKLDYRGVEEIYSALAQGYDGKIDNAKLEDGLKAGLVKAAGDPYTEYLNAEESKQFSEQLNGSFEGIGAELGKQNQYIVIISPIAGFPAAKAGLKAKDIILEIDGKSAYDIPITEAVKKIRGPKGSTVKLKVARAGKALEFTITRDQIVIPSVKTQIVAGNIGVMTISRFGDDTAQLSLEGAKYFKDKGVKGVVLDLRGNPGGLLDAAVNLSSLWLDKGQTVLQEKRGDTIVKTYNANGNNLLTGVPTIVLIDGGSASASEITAGALRDNKAATIYGEKSFGKGSVQELRNLMLGGVLKVTIARWYTPSGRNIDKEGIQPDKKIKFNDKDIKAGRDPQKDAALKALRQ